MSNGTDDTGVIGQGPSPLFTPDQLRRLRVSLSRSPFYCEQDYVLTIVMVSSVANLSVKVFVRFETLDGDRTPQGTIFAPTGDRTQNVFQMYLGEGLLHGVAVRLVQTGIDVGSVFALVFLGQSFLPNTTQIAVLFAGHPTNTAPIAWLGASNDPPDRIGVYRGIVGTTPAAGGEILETCPAGARWDLISCLLTFAPDGTGTTRYPTLLVTNATNENLLAAPSAAVAASTGQVISFSQSPLQQQVAGAIPGATYSWVPLPKPCTLLGGDQFSTVTHGIASGDRYAAPNYFVIETLRLN
jgi:hypothetical protein